MNNHKRIYAKFAGPHIFREQGRLLYALMHIFARSGYRIDLFDYLGETPLEKYGQMIHTLPALSLTREAPSQPEGAFLLYDEPDPALMRLPWAKMIQVRFDLFSPFWTSNPIIMPFPMHPMQSGLTADDIAALRTSERKVRIFFSGDTVNYHRVRVPYPRPKLPRQRIVETIKARLGEALILIQDAAELDALWHAPYTNKFALTASSEVRIEFADWLPTLARADFFLSPPGIIMPMCHNITEAMAVGTIPITNYPEWMDPPLRPGHDCLTFDTEGDLMEAIRQALAMDQGKILAMRAHVIDYYERHLRPDTFVARVEAHPDRQFPILMYTEHNMWAHPKKLGRYSILLQGTWQRRPPGILRRFWAAHTNHRVRALEHG